MLFLPTHQERKGEGGLRTKDRFKQSSAEIPLVSIITVVFNDDKYLEKTILSVIDQTYKNIEYIIIDGGSTDDTLNIICKHETFIDYWISEPDKGIYDAMNKGIQVAGGQLIGLLNSGDLYTDFAVEEVVKIFTNTKRNQYLIISGSMYRFDEKRNIEFKLEKRQEDLKAKINREMPVNHPATFVTRSVYETLGLFSPEYKICGDYDFIFRAYYSNITQFIFTDKELAHMMLGGTSEKFQNLWTRCVEQFSLRKEKVFWVKNIFISFYWLTIAVYKHFFKRILGSKIMSVYYSIRHKK